MTCCNIFEKFRAEELLIKEYEHWLLVTHIGQRTLGCCVVISKAHHPRFHELKEEEMKELLLVAKELEGALAQLWQFDNINWLMLMMKDKHTHFHVFPRYDTARAFEDMSFEADGETLDPLKLGKLDLSTDQLQQIRDAIAQTIK